jgi:DNA-binding LacI/PurR family transcriptional regulator
MRNALPVVPNLRELAKRAECDERTLIRYFSDEPVRPKVRSRIDRAMAEMRREQRTSKA